MKLTQLRYISWVVRKQFNISQTAEALHTTQPGVSTQIKMLEDEIGTQVFVRHGKRIIGLTPAGEAVYKLAEDTLRNIESIRNVGADYQQDAAGTLTIATTHTQARYMLPKIIPRFSKQFPDVKLRIRQGNPTELSEMLLRGEADIAIATEALGNDEKLHALPVYRWNRCVIAKPQHPIHRKRKIDLSDIAAYPIITYDFAFTGRTAISDAFRFKNIEPNIVITALDADIIKHYVDLELGIGILANMAFEPKVDKNLRAKDVSHLFEDSVTSIGIRKGQFLRNYIFAFIEMFAPHLTKNVVLEVMNGQTYLPADFDLKYY